MNKFRLMALLGVMTCGMLMPARADIVITLVGTASCGAGCFTWTYDAQLGTNAETSEADNGGPFTTFFTIYDVSGLIGGITNPAADPTHWSNTTQNTGLTPAGITPIPSDSASVPNITWTYNPISQVTGVVDLGHFSFNSSQANNGLVVAFTGQSTKDNPGQGDDDTLLANRGSVVGPSSAVPEPATLSLMGISLLGLGLIRRRQAKK